MDAWEAMQEADGLGRTFLTYDELGNEMIRRGETPTKPLVGGRNLPTSIAAASVIYAQAEEWIGFILTSIN
jgi:hypothetical protein